ncbi:hypothetical protein EC968_007715, partial [Mortierella alpina]
MKEINSVRRERYEALLKCARSGDKSTYIMFPSADIFEVPMAKVCPTLSVKLEYLDIYHYLKSRQDELRIKISKSNFGFLI